jgi:hypothetical protein
MAAPGAAAEFAVAPRSKDLDDLWDDVRALQRGMEATNPVRGDLARFAEQIELLRGDRLSAATTAIPEVFWLILILFVVASSFLSGRETPKRFGMQVNLMHMAAIGLAVGLVIAVPSAGKQASRLR